MSAVLCHSPASCARDLGHQMSHVESFEQTPKQGLADVGIAKATRDVVPVEHCFEESYVFTPRWVETGITATFDDFGLGELPQFWVGRRRIIHHCQGFKVAAVAGQRLLLIVGQGS